jgi:hypothetical protein
MRILPTKIHGFLDYLVGALLVASPWLFDFANGGARQWVPIVLGAGTIAYSLATDYELGIVRALPVPVHLALDVAGGAMLIASPWLFGFSEHIWIPHVAIGAFEIVAAALTQWKSDRTMTVGEETEARAEFGGTRRVPQ